jgi:hypothetical protein
VRERTTFQHISKIIFSAHSLSGGNGVNLSDYFSSKLFPCVGVGGGAADFWALDHSRHMKHRPCAQALYSTYKTSALDTVLQQAKH